MKNLMIVCFLIVMQQALMAQQRIMLYPSNDGIFIQGVDSLPPFVDYYPSNNTSTKKTAVIICPGGGYAHLAWDKEGVVPAKFFNDHGIDAFVLNYRLNNSKQTGHRYPAQYNDVTTAIRLVKSKASDFGIDAAKVGVMGFSAGGHLASCAETMLLEGDPASMNPLEHIYSRPAFAILLYPVITMDTSFAHRGSRNMLLGDHPSQALADSLSTDKRVTKNTPPTMLVLADDDKTVPPMNSIAFYTALKANKVPASMHIYDHGGHGFGTAPKDAVLNGWPMLCYEWLTKLGF